jgi:2,3-bisphosphoglycerate-independent phosphoglycerate mutase
MKFVVLVGDGMGDYSRIDLGGKTVLEAADTPNMDWIARNGRGGLAQTIPSEMQPGSDVANMELLGYDTTEQFTGRGIFEALSMGCTIHKGDVAFRVNLVTLENGRMKDYAAGHITTQESEEIMKMIDKSLGSEKIRFFPGVSYRNLMIWSGGKASMRTTPPHDIIGQDISPYMPNGEGSEVILSIMERSKPLLENSLVNRKREASGKNPANSLWLWGQGKSLELNTIEKKYGLSGGVISAVDLIKGIGISAGLKPVFVPGATGYIDTNYRGKAEAAIQSLETMDFMYVHVEAPDEAGHSGNKDIKLKAIEDFDREVVGPVLRKAQKSNDLAVLVTCDHYTPLEKRTHTREPVPFAYYGPKIVRGGMDLFSEKEAEKGAGKIIKGHELLNQFIGEFITL